MLSSILFQRSSISLFVREKFDDVGGSGLSLDLKRGQSVLRIFLTQRWGGGGINFKRDVPVVGHGVLFIHQPVVNISGKMFVGEGNIYVCLRSAAIECGSIPLIL